MSPVQLGRFSVMTMNVHKGLSPLHRKSTIYELRQKMRSHHPDLLFLQELQQEHRGRIRRFGQWPLTELTHFLSEDFWHDWHYGKNVEYPDGHHGNAILSKRPLRKGENYDISAYRFERRGLLHSVTHLEGIATPIHCFCVHLALFERGRERQLDEIIRYIDSLAEGGPTIVAGDFNDWGEHLHTLLRHQGLHTFEHQRLPTFPSRLPLLHIDRIYVRGLALKSAYVPHGKAWWRMSDHLPLIGEFGFLP